MFGKSNPHLFMKAAGNFGNKGNGHQPPTILYLQEKFQLHT